MKRSNLAAVISVLVFPGAGHLYLKRGRRACLFLLPAALASYFLTVRLVETVSARADAIVDQIMAGTLAADPAAIAEQISRQGGDASSPMMSLVSALLALCWIAAAVDAWLIGRRQLEQEREQQQAADSSAQQPVKKP